MKKIIYHITQHMYKHMLLIGVILVFLLSCSKKESISKEEPLTYVQGLQVVRAPLLSVVEGTGIVLGKDEVTIISKTQGTIEKVYFNLGDYVKAGDVLVSVERTIQKYQFSKAAQDLKNAKIFLNGSQELFKNGAISQQELVDARSKYYAAQTQYTATKSQYEDTIIRASVNGYISDKSRVISVGSVISQGAVVGRISNREWARVEMSIADSLIGWISKENKAEVRIQALGTFYVAHVQSISAAIDVKTGGVRVELIFYPKDKEAIRSGLVANVKIFTEKEGEHRNVLYPIIPKSIIFQEKEQKYIFLAEKGTVGYLARKVPVVTGREFLGRAEIISGIQNSNANPVVIISALNKLIDKQKIYVSIVGITDTF